jgi:hypothetical protein
MGTGGNEAITLSDDATTATPASPAGDGADAIPTTGSPSAGGAGSGISNSLSAPFELDRTVWFLGTEVTLTMVTLDSEEGTLVIEAEAQNQGDDPLSLWADARIEQGGVSIAEGQLRSGSSILGGSRNAASLEFRRVPGSFDPAKATLVLGDAKHQQVRVPFEGTDGLVTGEPVVQTTPEPLRVGSLVITTDELSVRHDNPQKHTQAAIGTAYVILDGSVRFDANTTNVQNQHLSLIPPNGAPQSPIYVNALPRNGASQDIYAAFPMPTPIGGEYTLRVTGDFVASDRPGRILDTKTSADLTITLNVDGGTGSSGDRDATSRRGS